LHQNGQDGVVGAGTVLVVVVDAQDHRGCLGPKLGGQSDDVEVVTHLVALHHEEGLDAQHLLERGHP